MKDYTYQNNLIGKKQLRQLLSWSFTNYDSMQACFLADELKYLGFRYATQAGISISIEDLKIPFVKNLMLEKANKEIIDAEKIYLQGKITDIERFQKIIDTWSITSESLKDEVIRYFKSYDPLNSVYIMAFSGARGNLSQVRQLVGMRGLMSDQNGEIMKLPIKKNFREGLTITDYLMSGYGARKGIIDTALKTANSGYLTRRLIDVAQDILIRDKECFTTDSFLISILQNEPEKNDVIYDKLVGRVLQKSIIDPETKIIIAKANTQLTPNLIKECQKRSIQEFYIRSPLTCNLYRAICQKCYGWDLATENLIDIGEAIGILAGQSIGEPGTQLTMRTFHTGGIFTSEARQQILSPFNGIIRFYKRLKTVILRTNRGEEVLVTKNSGSFIVIPEDKTQNFIKIEVLKNTILFPKNNQYILKGSVVGELINLKKQVKTEVKPILSDTSGEIFMPRLKTRINFFNNNQLIWILSGQLYNSPRTSFVNFYSDYKLNNYSFIFRTKIINHYCGFIEFVNQKQNLYQQNVRIKNSKYSFLRSSLQKLVKPIQKKNYLLTLENLKCLVKIKTKNLKSFLQIARQNQFGILVNNSFQTFTGGILYYDYQNLLKRNKINKNLSYYKYQFYFQANYKSTSSHRTMIWVGEESHKLKCEQNLLLVENGDFISENFEIIPDHFSKTSGIATVQEKTITVQRKETHIQIVSIKSGLVYEGQKLETAAQKIYYPGELIFSNIPIEKLSFCEHILGNDTEQLLIRSIELYEFPYSSSVKLDSQNKTNLNTNLKLESTTSYIYKPNQTLKSTQNLNLIANTVTLKSKRLLSNNLTIELENNPKINSVDFKISEKLCFTNHSSPSLKYKNLQSSFLLQKNQFVDRYTILGYLEAITFNPLEIVKFKVKEQDTKQILLISNQDCFTLEKDKFPNKKLNDFIIDSSNANKIGKIIIENNEFLTLQKGKPYFFPNCQNDSLTHNTSLQYKLVSPNYIQNKIKVDHSISLSHSETFKLSILSNDSRNYPPITKSEIPKLFLKKNGKFYSYSFFNRKFRKGFSINKKESNLKFHRILASPNFSDPNYFIDPSSFPENEKKNKKVKQILRRREDKVFKKKLKKIFKKDPDKILEKNLKERLKKKIGQTLLIKNFDTIQNQFRDFNSTNYQLALIKLVQYGGIKQYRGTKKLKGIYSITEDFFEQDLNSVFCKNNQFIEQGETLGLLNLEKEITGDIVQGLPRIEEILEARKKNVTGKRIPTSQKKSLLIQKTNLDPNFELRKLGTSIQENEKINPQKLLIVYFNYYGLIKSFFCDRTESVKYTRLMNHYEGNYEGIYKSFKKVQSFILNSVQAIYQSQGVTINDKHLEVIIKQMTTKVLVTSEGNTPLLRGEVVDLYHMQYMNQIIRAQEKQPAYYVPLLFGITKAALNNPSFISAASFQETIRVLTKAAIEGRIDWLRGLKENIIIGHFIPAGTGFPDYRNSFRRYTSSNSKISTNSDNFTKLETLTNFS